MLNVVWIDSGREPKCAPNQEYPDGIDVDVSRGANAVCRISLRHPTPRCGYYIVRCSECDYAVAITTAGRPDDPRSVTMPCQIKRTK